MLTVQQADILALLTDFKYLRYSHIKQYIAAKHNSTDEHISTMLKQLSFLGKVKVSGGYVSLPGRKYNEDVIKAFDVVMDLTSGRVDGVYPGIVPFGLMFTAKPSGGALAGNAYGTVVVKNGFEKSINARIRSIDRNLTVIFLLSDREQQKMIKAENRSYFSIQDSDGKYRFFKAAANQP